MTNSELILCNRMDKMAQLDKTSGLQTVSYTLFLSFTEQDYHSYKELVIFPNVMDLIDSVLKKVCICDVMVNRKGHK